MSEMYICMCGLDIKNNDDEEGKESGKTSSCGRQGKSGLGFADGLSKSEME